MFTLSRFAWRLFEGPLITVILLLMTSASPHRGNASVSSFALSMEVITWALLSGKKCSEITKQNLFANSNHKASIESEEKLQADETSYWHFILSLA